MQRVMSRLASQIPAMWGANACIKNSDWAARAQRLDHHQSPRPGISLWVDQMMERVMNPRL
jgi:hypothetical protein